MKIFYNLNNEPKPQVVEVSEEISVKEFIKLISKNESVAESMHLFLDDTDDVIDPNKTLKDAGVLNKHHVTGHPCRQIKVIIEFNGLSEKLHVGAGVTINALIKRAARLFGITPQDAAQMILKLNGVEQPSTVHIGTLVSPESKCTVTLELCKKVVAQG
jgi:hypothetical protein